MLVQTRVDGSTPDGGVVGERAADVLNALGRSHHTHHMHLFGSALGQQSLVAHLHRAARGKHGVYDEQRGVVEVGCGKIFYMYAHLGVSLVLILAERRHEGVAGVVEDVKEPLVERQAGAEDRSEHQLVGGHAHAGCAQRGLHVALLIVESLAELISNELAHTHDVVTEKQTVGLIVFVAHLSHILVDDAVLFCKVDDFHILYMIFVY